jgi:hypothetical protein
MPYKDKEKEKARGISRRAYFRERSRLLRNTQELPISMTTNVVGSVGEKLFLDKFSDASWVGRPYDGECYLGKIDVKTSKPTYHNLCKKKKWKFHLARQRGIVDNFILFCLEDDLNINKVLVVPDKDLEVNDVTIMLNSKSKYDKYRINL